MYCRMKENKYEVKIKRNIQFNKKKTFKKMLRENILNYYENF